MRKLLLLAVAALVLLVAADRITVHVVEGVVASRMQADGRLDATPSVDIAGFPFLTQAVQGVYPRTDVHVRDLTRNGLTVARLDVTVRNAHLKLTQVNNARSLPVDGLEATALVSYYELGHSSGIAGLTVTPAGSRVKVTGKVAGVQVSVTSTITLKDNRILVSAQRALLDFSVRIPTLPYGLTLTSAEARPDGVHLTARSGPTVLTAQ